MKQQDECVNCPSSTDFERRPEAADEQELEKVRAGDSALNQENGNRI